MFSVISNKILVVWIYLFVSSFDFFYFTPIIENFLLRSLETRHSLLTSESEIRESKSTRILCFGKSFTKPKFASYKPFVPGVVEALTEKLGSMTLLMLIDGIIPKCPIRIA